ncbi:hypothetical protein BWQ96_04489 [Gracilariopsis chorda]|uniref:Uncharacterized protein n=1 Tax=Gracilariopsis chorda TaxID=448386 RepID=A0A2V3IUD3_9FLOR|nr:hypothetical protein BWQ96_04489 [Gracilariopsis chorda]|eukprot:PXF45721.1 hypothetical protein BWQ96_04489 [Gracilariopsis chorda]
MFRSVQLLAAFAAILAVSVHAQVPPGREESCGAIISSVISVCSHPTLSRPDWCCNELIKWNDARCWCEPSAFDALDTIAQTGNAFSFRDGFCPGTFFRPAWGSIRPEFANCPAFVSTPDTDTSEQCSIDSAQLRIQRMASLDALSTDSVQNLADLGPWFLRMDALFTEEAELEMVGLFLGRGRFEVKQYLLTRQQLYSFLPIVATETSKHFWRNPRMVSYRSLHTTSARDFTQQFFVTFERCSPRVERVNIVDNHYQRRYGQFWDPSSSQLMARYQQSSYEWCTTVRERCAGDSYPFADDADCQAFYNDMKGKGQVTCNKFSQPYIPQYAMHGDVLACRNFYLDLAIVDAAGACPAVGKTPNQFRCDESQCAGASYVDPFSHDSATPQFSENPSLTCTATSCVENWPTQEQIDEIPEEERTKFAGGSGFTLTDATTPEIAAGGVTEVTAEQEFEEDGGLNV